MGGGSGSSDRNRDDDTDREMDDRADDLEDDEELPDFDNFIPEESAAGGGDAGDEAGGAGGISAAHAVEVADSEAGEAAGVGVEGDGADSPMDLGPEELKSFDVDVEEYDPETIEEEFGVDLSDTETLELFHSGNETVHLSPRQQSELEEALRAKHGEAFDRVNGWASDWKGTSKGEGPESLELTAKRALGIGAPVRSGDGEPPGVNAAEVTDADVAAYRDMVRVSRGFLIANGGTREGVDGRQRVSVHRGIPHSRTEVNGSVARQLLTEPDKGEVTVGTSVLTNHSLDREEATDFAATFSIHHAPPMENIGDTKEMVTGGMVEAEVHVGGGELSISTDGVGVHSGESPLSGTDVQTAIRAPEQATAGEHAATYDLLKQAARNNESVDNPAALDRLEAWADHASGHGVDKSPRIIKLKIDQLRPDGSDNA